MTTLTILRLELYAALLLARMLSHHLTLLNNVVTIDRIRAWTDSMIVLMWNTQEYRQFKIFVTNRIAKIRGLIPNYIWAHVRTADNPTDPASRGMLPRDLVSCSKHLTGPGFLRQDDSQWSLSEPVEVTVPVENLSEYKRPTKCALHIQYDSESDELLRRF
jgi:hypothetical protein